VHIFDEAESIVTGSVCVCELSKIAEFDRSKLKGNTILDLGSGDVRQAAGFYRDLFEGGKRSGEEMVTEQWFCVGSISFN
jgi:hypothetical protein